MAILSKITIGEAFHLYVDADPTVPANNAYAPIGSVAWLNDGTKAWRNTTGLANGWQSDASLLNLGTMAAQNAPSVAITGGTAHLGSLLLKGDGTEGGQIYWGYKTKTDLVDDNDVWSMDVFNTPSNNSFRFFNKTAAGFDYHWTIDEATKKQAWGGTPVTTHQAKYQFMGDTYAYTNYVIVGVYEPTNVPAATNVRYVLDSNGAGNNMQFYRTINGSSPVYPWIANYVTGVLSMPENNNQTKVALDNRGDAATTTQWVYDRLRNSRVVAATTTLLPTDNIIIVENAAVAVTLTIPTALNYVHITRGVGSTGTITVVATSATIMALNRTMAATTTLEAAGANGDSVELMRHPTNTALVYRK